MKTFITNNLLKFSGATILLTLLFRAGLSHAISNKLSLIIALVAIMYAVFMYVNGRYFGVKEYENLPIYDIGFRFHLATYIGHTFVSILWFVANLQSKYENSTTIYYTALIWGVFLVIHFLYYIAASKKSIKNLDRESLFE